MGHDATEHYHQTYNVLYKIKRAAWMTITPQTLPVNRFSDISLFKSWLTFMHQVQVKLCHINSFSLKTKYTWRNHKLVPKSYLEYILADNGYLEAKIKKKNFGDSRRDSDRA